MTKLNRDVSGLTRNVFVSITSMLAIMFAWMPEANAVVPCTRTVVANVVAIDQPIMYNRLGASNINGMVYALRRDVIDVGPNAAGAPIWRLRPDKRPRPLVLRVREGDCLTINLENRLQALANPFAPPINIPPNFNTLINDQVADRHISMHVNGLEYVNGPGLDDGAFVGNNADSTIPNTGTTTRTYELYAREEGAFAVRGMATTVGADANQGNSANLLFGEVIVEPANSAIYRSQVTEEEMRLASMDITPTSETCGQQRLSDTGHPIINYEARYPATALTCISTAADGTVTETIVDLGHLSWIAEGKDGLPILNMIDTDNNEIVHSEINAFVGYGSSGELEAAPDGPYAGRLGHFPVSTYPLENVGKRNPTVPNRLEPFRDFASIFHDEPSTKQAFPGFYEPTVAGGNDVFRYVLEGVKDGFMINYGSGGIGSEIIANRLGVGPMHDCLTCAYEEFFLTSYTVSDPATLVDIPANFGLEDCRPQDLGAGPGGPCAAVGPKANKALYTEDPSNVHHSYVGDFAKIRNVHVGQEQHVFHLHNHQWLYNPNDDNSNYLDAQGIGPGIGYTYEINFGGSGNRNKSAGDSIFHCHFYPHFAQGMWAHWRHHDTFEAGTLLQASATVNGFHDPFTANGLGLGDGTPAAGARALPDGEIVAGVPIPALVPLPGKPMAPMPGAVTIKPNPNLVAVIDPVTGTPVTDAAGAPVQQAAGSLAHVNRTGTLINPGYPFWIAGIEDVVGQRPPSPPLDMVTPQQVDDLQDPAVTTDPQLRALFADLDVSQADGWDGGLPRAALQGYAAGGADLANVITPIDFSKVIGKATAVFYPETGTDVEHVAMKFHAQRCHESSYPDGSPAACDPGSTGTPDLTANADGFITNGQLPAIGAPYHEPCLDDQGIRLGNGVVGNFFSGNLTTIDDPAGMTTTGSSVFNADTPRIYKAANIQYDAVINKVGYHYPQQRIIALWQDAVPTITKERAGQPLVMRINSFDCAIFHHTNLVPEVYEADDYQVRTPTDIIGQHIHLPKWDLTTADGSANGWNYEDGTFSPGAIQERIHALNCFTSLDATECPAGITPGGGTHTVGAGTPAGFPVPTHLNAADHPYFSTVAPAELAAHWKGARTTTQRWFADPVVNTDGEDRGLGIIFTHDHYGPSTHQQIGLYATVLTEPAGSAWVHNETGAPIGYSDPNAPTRTFTTNDGRVLTDGGPTAWQAAILPVDDKPPFREFYLEYSDFQHAYEAGVYVGTGQLGEALPGTGPGLPPVALNEGNPAFTGVIADAFRFAINPPARVQIAPVMPDLVLEVEGGAVDALGAPLHPGCPTRPCPQAIDVQDPGMMVVNYRNEPVGLRIYDPNKMGPDGVMGMQADGDAGDLALAMASRTDRAIPELNVQPDATTVINGTRFPPPINTAGANPGDPYTPMLRAFTGDLVRVKMQSGGHEEEHNATIHGLKWLQGGSGHGKSGNSGWRAAHAGGISEQFTLVIPPVPVQGSRAGFDDYGYSMDASHDGWWTGMWGVLRAYNNKRGDLYPLPTTVTPLKIAKDAEFDGPCPVNADLREFDITAVLANMALPNPGFNIADPAPQATRTFQTTDALGNLVDVTVQFPTTNLGNVPLDPTGGSLVYNNRDFTDAAGTVLGKIHDPTAVLYFHSSDMVAIDPTDPNCITGNGRNQRVDPNLPGCPVRLADGKPIEPVVIRAAAGDCIEVTLRNKLPALQAAVDFQTGQPVIDPATGLPVLNSSMPDMANLTTLLGVVKRDRFALQGATTLQPNMLRTSSHVGLHSQLVTYDVSRHNGMRIGNSGNQTVAPGKVMQRIRWYAGDLTATVSPNGREFQLTATPIEFGGANIQPADPIKQGAKSLVGALVIEPAGTTWDEVGDDAIGRQSATVKDANDNVLFRDFSLVLSKALTQYWTDGTPVQHMNGEGVGIPEDSQEATGMALNYGIDPVWHRLGIMPNAEFGAAGAPLDTFGAQPVQFDVFANAKVGGDPQTPVFTANAGDEVRMRVTVPYGTSRGSTITIHGHLWQRDPYICSGSKDGIVGRCATNVVGAQMIGDNKQAFYQSAQESINPSTHFDIVLPSAGGTGANTGDYMFRDYASLGSASGLWGILRVIAPPAAAPAP